MTYEDLTKEQQDRLQSLWSLGEEQRTMGSCSREAYEFDELMKHCEKGHNCDEDCKRNLEKMEQNAKFMFSGEEII